MKRRALLKSFATGSVVLLTGCTSIATFGDESSDARGSDEVRQSTVSVKSWEKTPVDGGPGLYVVIEITNVSQYRVPQNHVSAMVVEPTKPDSLLMYGSVPGCGAIDFGGNKTFLEYQREHGVPCMEDDMILEPSSTKTVEVTLGISDEDRREYTTEMWNNDSTDEFLLKGSVALWNTNVTIDFEQSISV